MHNTAAETDNQRSGMHRKCNIARWKSFSMPQSFQTWWCLPPHLSMVG